MSVETTPVWRQFSFFEQSEVKDANDLGSSPEAFRSLVPPYVLISPSPLSPLSSTITTIISDSEGYISLLDRKFQVEKRWKAWATGADLGNGKGKEKEREKGVMLLECGGVLLGIGEDDSSSQFPILKIWDLMHDDKKTKNPVLMRNVRIGLGNRPFPVSSIATTSNLSYLAIGLVSGQVLLYRHLSQSLTTSPLALSSFPKARVVWEGSMAEPITGLGFREPASISQDSHPSHTPQPTNGASTSAAAARVPLDKEVTSLFITTTNKVLCAPSVTGRGSDPKVLDEVGAGLGCVSMDLERRELVVGRDDGIYLYGVEEKGSAIAYEGPKSSIYINNQSCIFVSPPFTPTSNSNSATIRRAAAASSSSTLNSTAKVTIFDLSNKIVAFSGVFKEGVREIFGNDGEVYVIVGDGKISRLRELPTSSKLDALFRKSYYQMAITLAKSSGIDAAGIADIHTKYGDHLYTKGDFDGAMSQFVKTLGFLQPSYVIRKFLDAQRIHNLTTYLQELHARGLANPDHTTLLLNCYTKTADKTRLDSFLKTETLKTGDGQDGELPFDLDTAIRVCRQAGFYENAVYLAKKYGRHEEYLRIQIEDAGDYGDVLAYLRALGPKIAEENLLRYGRAMLQHQPKETTDLLIDLCSGTMLEKREQARQEMLAAAASKGNAASTGTAYLSYLGYDKVTGVLGLGSEDKPNGKNGDEEKGENGEEEKPEPKVDTTYPIPSPRQYYAHYIDNPIEFARFLESVAEIRWGQRIELKQPKKSRLQIAPMSVEDIHIEQDEDSRDQRSIWNTLLELYLLTGEDNNASRSTTQRQKALQILQQADSLPVDPMHGLILCSTSNFTAGLVGIWEKLGMYEDVLRFWMEKSVEASLSESIDRSDFIFEGRSPSENVLYHLELYGPNNLHLYPLVLRFLTSSPALLSRHTSDLKGILQVIDDERIMPPLAVVQLLSRNNVASIGVVKDWLRAKVAETRQDVESDKQLVKSYRAETEEKQAAIAELTNPDKPVVFQVTRCASCGGQLDLPSVHFMCKHSYHQRCLPDSDPECPSCARQHAVIRELRRNQEALADRHDLFLSEVSEAEDGFAVVAGAFGRGLFAAKGLPAE